MPEPSDHPEQPVANQTDADLYLALRGGQTAALGILYDRHARLVYGLALKTLSNAQEAEDLTQDIFLNLARSTSYDPRRGSLRTFLGILTRSRAIDRIRSRSTALSHLERLRSEHNSETPAQSPFDQVSQTEQSQEVKTALAQLSESEQQLLQMAYYEGLSQSEIAERLSMPLGTVKTRTRRSLIKLRQTLTDYIG
ncbi:RNA polymerase subunit sigma [Phormidesmis priestleyi ULC007]|uniref:RNA polymerase subunit sigma n=1 Tax=Phormidesmis priestleyi ULC007 TaxID=1920490 RepID=A0A2T1DFI7_9CYAN|nr:sigma-70 family RNA polymerase sigma factor [Phormidesmis priestleyi]PSB19223.1 RNA polymerase subunit sigma [Phormidesmis priestleyi ULC007]PZO48178.1 MAG: RNA polymerase subunit sigma [Phormidesmis priestleyi]